jgi:hypothetical protein
VCERCLFERSESRCVTRAKETYGQRQITRDCILCTIVLHLISEKRFLGNRNELAKKKEEPQAYNTNSLFVFDKKTKKRQVTKNKINKKRKRDPE